MDPTELLVNVVALVGMLLVALMAVIPTAMASGPDGGRAAHRNARPRAAGYAQGARPRVT